jgi:isopentenyl diphosphate isomerase/L-lactate dehydrogenase-like FMN-dependent dehydrogenase
MKPLNGVYQFGFEQREIPEGVTLFPVEEKKLSEEDAAKIRQIVDVELPKTAARVKETFARLEHQVHQAIDQQLSHEEIKHQRRIIAVLLHKLGGKVEIDARDIAELGSDTINVTRSFENLNWLLWVGDSPFPQD